MEETLDGPLARVFGGPAPRGGRGVAGSPSGAERSVKILRDAAASALTRPTEELRRLDELLQRLREAGGR